MNTQSPRRGHGEGSNDLGGDHGHSPTPSRASEQRREPFRVVIEPDPFGYGFDVAVLPAPDGIGHDRQFRTYSAALEYGEALAEATSWPLIDRTGG